MQGFSPPAVKINSELLLQCTIYATGFNFFEFQIRFRFYSVQDLHLLSGLVPVTESCVLKFTFFSLPLFTFWKLWDFPADEHEHAIHLKTIPYNHCISLQNFTYRISIVFVHRIPISTDICLMRKLLEHILHSGIPHPFVSDFKLPTTDSYRTKTCISELQPNVIAYCFQNGRNNNIRIQEQLLLLDFKLKKTKIVRR